MKSNFEFLNRYWPVLAQLGANAENYLYSDPNVCVYKLGLFAERLVQEMLVFEHMFLSSVRKYTRARKLTPRMLNELIEKIEVHQAEKTDGKTVQRLTLHYNCIGRIEIPDLEKIPGNEVSVHTRQGVDVHYAPCAS